MMHPEDPERVYRIMGVLALLGFVCALVIAIAELLNPV